MKKFIISNRFTLLIVISILLLMTSLFFTSYSYYIYDASSAHLNANATKQINITCGNVSITNSGVSSSSLVPMRNETAWTSKKHETITIKNNCNTSKKIYIYFVPTSGNTIDLGKVISQTYDTSTNTTLRRSYVNTTKTSISTAISNDLTKQGKSVSGSYMYYMTNSVTISAGTTKQIDYLFWVDYFEGNSTSPLTTAGSTLNKKLEGYVVVYTY